MGEEEEEGKEKWKEERTVVLDLDGHVVLPLREEMKSLGQRVEGVAWREKEKEKVR